MIDPVDLTAALVRCPSVTPDEAGCFDVLAPVLAAHGFEIFRADRGVIKNLVARFGRKGANRMFGFNGHIDVVPPGDAALWTHPPFSAAIADGKLWGRGACDMKSGVACFVAAACDYVTAHPDAAILITITGDEEADATDGTPAILDFMAEHGETMAACLVGEPTCPSKMGEMMKIGRRGSMNAKFVAHGTQSHSAYPHRAKNPVHAMTALMHGLTSEPLDQGSATFEPSTLAVTSIDTGNLATNVIPAECRAALNIRFNDLHTSARLTDMLRQKADKVTTDTGVTFDMQIHVSGESFVTPPGALSTLVSKAVKAETGVTPELSTSGGTSDARFIKSHCPVVE
ncbi:MAG: succinyl-diaminopimelate desuccinylase, partial [Deltaproteobacteria bacterium]